MAFSHEPLGPGLSEIQLGSVLLAPQRAGDYIEDLSGGGDNKAQA